MAQTVLDENRLKEIFKAAIGEMFEEKRDLLYEVFLEALEDVALLRAIEEGENTKPVSKKEIFASH